MPARNALGLELYLVGEDRLTIIGVGENVIP
jgi:hypothetical protein